MGIRPDGHDVGVRRVQHGRDLTVARLLDPEPVLRAEGERAEAQGYQDAHPRHRDRQPGRDGPGKAEERSLCAGPVGDRRRLLAHPGRLGEDLLTQPRRGCDSGGLGQPARCLTETARLVTAGLARVEVAHESSPVGLAEGIQCVRPGQRVRVGPPQPHCSAPRQSRIRMSPSLIRVFTVPIATPSRPATSR